MIDKMKDSNLKPKDSDMELTDDYVIREECECNCDSSSILTDAIDEAIDEMVSELVGDLIIRYDEEIDKVELEIFKNCKNNGDSSSDAAIEMDNITKDIIGLFGLIRDSSNEYPGNEESFRRLVTLYMGKWMHTDYTDDIDAIQ